MSMNVPVATATGTFTFLVDLADMKWCAGNIKGGRGRKVAASWSKFPLFPYI